MLKTINLKHKTNADALHTLSADEIDLVAGGFNWAAAIVGAAFVAIIVFGPV
jgi:hypothetical protein